MAGTAHTPTVVVVNQKGGVGKTFVADELAFWCERHGAAAYLLDLDQQGGVLNAADPDDAGEGADVVVVDTPGAITRELRTALLEADAVVVPVLPSEDDVPATERTMRIVEGSYRDVAGFVVVNGRTRFVASREFEAHVAEWEARGWRALRVPRSEAVVRARKAKRSVVDHAPRSKVAAAVDAMCAEVIGEVLGHGPEQRA